MGAPVRVHDVGQQIREALNRVRVHRAAAGHICSHIVQQKGYGRHQELEGGRGQGWKFHRHDFMMKSSPGDDGISYIPFISRKNH